MTKPVCSPVAAFKGVTGWVNLYLPQYDLGYIQPDPDQRIDKRIFFHRRMLTLRAFDAVEVGKRVTCDLYPSRRGHYYGYRASNIEIQNNTYIDQPYRAGIVKFYPQAGYGFIQALDAKNISDIYLHQEAILDAGYSVKELLPGTVVTVERTCVTLMHQARTLVVDRLAPRPAALTPSAPDLHRNLEVLAR